METAVTYPCIDLSATGRRITALREQRGLSVREVQDFLGLEYPQAIYKWQWGMCLPSVDNLLALARLLRVPMEEILVTSDRDLLFLLLRIIRPV